MSLASAVLSVDLELFTHTPAYRSASDTVDDRTVGLTAVDFLLEAFAVREATSTFFTVADIAEEHPGLISKIAAAGHEIASHTRTHAHLSSLDEDERRQELVESRRLLADASDEAVIGFRAPSFDLPLDCYDQLAETGYEYDSSVVPSRRIPGWYGGEHTVDRPCSVTELVGGGPTGLTELPIAVMPHLRLPLTGSWLRFFGLRYTVLGMRMLARRGISPMLYIHPWELVELPRIEGVPYRVYWRTGPWMRRAVSRLLDQPFDYVSAQTLIEGHG